MAERDFRAQLKSEVLVCDGAMGTELYNHGVFINRCFDELNLDQPRLVGEVHSAYVNAGANIIETNTFGANRFKLTPHGLGEKCARINRRGAEIARAASGDRAFVAGAIGPLGIRIEPWGPTSLEEAREAFREQAEALVQGGVDLFIIETFFDLSEIQQAILAVQEVSDLPIVAQMTLEDDGNSLYGTSPETFTERLDQWGADVIGVNCSVGPQVMLGAVERMQAVTEKPLSVQPNAGKPRAVEGRNLYLCSPEYMAEFAKQVIPFGVRLIGGCCGTRPEHIKAIAATVRALQHTQRKPSLVEAIPRDEQPQVDPVPRAERSGLAAALENGEFAISVEVVPPRGCDPESLLSAVGKLKGKIHTINIPDGPRASSRMGALALAVRVEQDLGMETILHYCCRDRNLLAMQSDLLGASALGVKNILIITGDPPKMGDYPDATAVFDVDSIGLTNMVNRLNHGLDLGSNPIGKPTGYLIGVGVNPGSLNLDQELRRFEYKVEAGAEFAITQPVFDQQLLADFLKRAEHFRIPILAGIWPLVSYRNAQFMNNEVPGATVPGEILARMKKTETKEQGIAEGLAIARESVTAVRGMVQGIQVAAPFGRYQLALQVLEAV